MVYFRIIYEKLHGHRRQKKTDIEVRLTSAGRCSLGNTVTSGHVIFVKYKNRRSALEKFALCTERAQQEKQRMTDIDYFGSLNISAPNNNIRSIISVRIYADGGVENFDRPCLPLTSIFSCRLGDTEPPI